MLLTPAERILLLNILPPAEGNALFLRSVRKMRKDISFSEEEIADWKIVNPAPGVFRWDESVSKPVEIEFSENATTYLHQCLVRASDEGKLHEGILSVYDQLFPES